MGVPKFYRWISERYPCLSEVVKEYQIPEFDNLYLDMNGIIHVCSHPEDDNPHFRITEEKIFKDIFHYIEVLFRLIKPKEVFFMAVDGVAPRAKMNQQRGRRFRSAKEAEDVVRKALEKGEILPKEQRFDSNCITPGTPFMVRLQEQLKYFVTKKVSTDRLWQGIRIYLSGHETPGEGEHKIMDFIRSERAKPDHDPNTRHCLYGLDADLIMLGLTSHEPHFSLLREEVRFGGKQAQKRTTAPEETTFHLLHLSLMREYLDFEFGSLKNKLPFPYDLENIIDDWVLMGFLVGNDFIPHLPHIHIHQEALPLLWKTYMETLPTLDGYLNEGGDLNLARFEKYLKALAKHDIDEFSEKFADLKWLEGKVGGKALNEEAGRGPQKIPKFRGIPTANEYMALVDLTDEEAEAAALKVKQDDVEEEEEEEEEEIEEEEEEEEEGDTFNLEFRRHKNHYYMEKLDYSKVTSCVLKDQAEGYVRAIQWILHYYYNGVPSWSWFYPHHYAPYISDVKDFSDMKIEFDYGRPFLPFQQLMAVLPAASKNLLPPVYQEMMINEDSPIVDFYPQKFDTDLNGKLQEWEAVVLIPFIDEERLLKAMSERADRLTAEEKGRNKHGPHLLYEYTPETQGVYPSLLPDHFPDITNNFAKCTEIQLDHFVIPRNKLKKGLCSGVKQDLYFPGFPTLKHIRHTAQLSKEGVKVFQMNSRGENMMLNILGNSTPDLEQVAHEYLGRSVYVAWPHLEEARVVKVGSDGIRYILKEDHKNTPTKKKDAEILKEEMDRDQVIQWHKEVANLKDWYHDRKGVEVGETDVLVYACPMRGRKYVCGAHAQITLEKQWAENSQPFLFQTTVKDIAVMDPTFTQYKTLDQLFSVKSEAFMLGWPHYGVMGEVLGIDPKNDGRIRVEFTILREPDFDDINRREKRLATQYLPGYIVAQRLGIGGHLVSRITGTVFITRGSKDNPGSGNKVNIGLNLKFNKKGEEVPGYTKKTEDGWLYSDRLLDILADYIRQFPDLFDFLSRRTNEDLFYEDDIFPENEGGMVQKISEFIKNLPCTSADRLPHGSEILDELVIKEIEKEVEKIKEINRKKKKVPTATLR